MSIEQIHSEFDALTKDLDERAQCPPNCFIFMRAEYVAYESRTSLTIRFPVLQEYLNPVQTMQGGFITAAIDNTMGPLSYLAARNPCSTLDLHTQYLRPILEGDFLIVTARVTSRGPQTLTVEAEAVNSKGKPVARATSTMLVVRK